MTITDTSTRRDRICYNDLSAVAVISSHRPSDGPSEFDLIIRCTDSGLHFESQLSGILQAYANIRLRLGHNVRPVFKRFFLSDSANQSPRLPEECECARSVVEQPPLDGSKIALWVYLQEDVKVTCTDSGMWMVSHGCYTHFWQGGMAMPDLRSEVATRALLYDYSLRLGNEGCSLAGNCVRTWFFVRDVDVNYAGMVKGRNEVFSTVGLTSDTHFIASTGIGGRNPDTRVTVTLDTYSVKGTEPEQIHYLYAPDHMNPTYEYGVAFERGTCVDYGDRRHVFISGTASIDNRGEVVHKDDIRLQTLRMWDNVEALLAEAECGWNDVGHMIVYLRDLSDYCIVSKMFESRFPLIPYVIVLAPVCRPEWLIEMECSAVIPLTDNTYDRF